MSQQADTEASPKIASPFGSASHKCVIGMNWVNVPGLGKLSVWVDKNGDTESITIYNATVSEKKTHTSSNGGHWVDLDIKADKLGDEQ